MLAWHSCQICYPLEIKLSLLLILLLLVVVVVVTLVIFVQKLSNIVHSDNKKS